MRRFLPPIATCLLLTLALAPWTGASIGLAAPDGPSQGPPAAPVLEAAVHGTGLLYRSLPGAQVLVELRDAAGEVKGSSSALADAAGEARIRFGSYVSPDGNMAAIAIGGSPTVIEPGDRLRILQVGAPAREVEIPNLGADVDVEADRVAGTGPAGAELEVRVAWGTDQAYSGRVTVGGDGRWSLDLPDPVDLGRSEDSVSLTWTSPERYRFGASAAPFSADITLGANQVLGGASSGTQVALTVETPAGQSLDYGPQTAIDGRWSLTLGSSGFGPVGPGGPGGPSQPVPHRIGPGDVLTFSQTGGPLAADRSWTVTVPEIAIDIDPQADTVTGRAPADGELLVLARSVWGEGVARRLTAAADGSFAADLSGQADLGPGWRVTAWWQAEPSLRVGGLAVVPVVEAGVDVASLGGLAEPGQRITVTLSTSGGERKSRQVTTAAADGRFAVQHRPEGGGMGGIVLGGDSLPAEQGDRIEVELTAGDPLLLTVPELTAVTDVLSDTVEGVAPAGAQLRLDWGGPAAVTGRVAADGSYAVELSGLHDIAPGSMGRLTVFDSRGHAFFTPWSAPRLSVQVGQAGVGGVAAPGRRLEATLLAPDGAPVAEAETTVPDFSMAGAFGIDPELLGGLAGGFYLGFSDVAGDPVPVRSGDRVRVYSGDEMAELTVPPLDGTVLVESDLVSGRTEPGRALTIEAVPFGGGRVSVAVTADENGNFSHAFAGQPDLRYNDVVGLATDLGGHDVGRTITVPGLTLDLDASRLSGTIWLNTRYLLEARREGALLASTRSVSGPDGEFSAQLLGEDGRPVPLREGDVLNVIQITRQGGEPLAMTVPELSIGADPISDQVAGLATPGGRLVLLARGADSAFGISQSWPEIGPDGSWQADFIPAWDVAPGTAIAGQYRLPEGHVALRTYYVPQLRAEIGGPNVCGFTRPGGEVTAFLREGGSSLASARATARYDGRFQAVLGDARGDLVRTAGGQNVGADLGTGSVINLSLPDLALDMDWQSGMLTGTGPADQRFEIRYPARRCMEGLAFGGGFAFAIVGSSGPDGGIQSRFPLPVAPGDGIEIALPRTDGHESYLQLYRPLGQVFVETPRVTGRANAGARLSFELLDVDLRTKGSASAEADANGGFEALIRNDAGELVPMLPEDTLEIAMGGSVVARIVVEPLSFDWSAGEPVFGTAKPSRQVLLQLKLADGRLLSIPRVTSGNGQWSFTAAEVPPRATWSLDDVASVRATIDTLDGHQIVFQTPGFEPDEPAPRPPVHRLHLPWLGRGASTRSLADGDPGAGSPRWQIEPAARAWPGVQAAGAPRAVTIRSDGEGERLLLPLR